MEVGDRTESPSLAVLCAFVCCDSLAWTTAFRRPQVYRKTKCTDQLYPLILDTLHMICRFEGRTVTVLKVERLADTEYADEKIGVSNLPTASARTDASYNK